MFQIKNLLDPLMFSYWLDKLDEEDWEPGVWSWQTEVFVETIFCRETVNDRRTGVSETKQDYSLICLLLDLSRFN